MPILKRLDVDGYMAQLPKAAVPQPAKLRGLTLAAVPDLVETELRTPGPGW